MIEQSSEALWPFSERNGVNVAADIEVLLAEPEIQLSSEDRFAAQTFAREIFEGNIEGGPHCKAERSLEEVNKLSVLASEQTFYTGYFNTEAGKSDLAGMRIDPATNNIDKYLLDVITVSDTVDEKVRKQVAINSLNWYKEQVAEHLKGDGTKDALYEDAESITVNYEPDKLLDKLEYLQNYRRFYRHVRAGLGQEEPSDLLTAKQTVLDVHIARVNNLMAGLYTSAANLARQLDACEPGVDNERWTERLVAIAPVISNACKAANREHFEQFADTFARRLDLVRNGAALDENEQPVPISKELKILAEQLTGAPEGTVTAEARVTPEQLKIMDTTFWTGEQLKEFNETILAKWGLLSEHQTDWVEAGKRSGTALDGKWQYVVDPKRKSLAVDGTKKIVFGPEVFGRNLTDESPAGGLPVSAHELTHVLQNEYDEELAKQIPLAKTKGARYVAVREMAGIMQENVVQGYFGRSRGTNLHYLRALQTKLDGGNLVQTARAFYESQREGKQLSEATDKKLRDMAVDRSLRLYRNDGHESQPLDYAEQDLIARGFKNVLPTERSAIAIAGGSFSLRHSAALHRVGLLEVPKEVADNPAEDVWSLFVEEYLPELK